MIVFCIVLSFSDFIYLANSNEANQKNKKHKQRKTLSLIHVWFDVCIGLVYINVIKSPFPLFGSQRHQKWHFSDRPLLLPPQHLPSLPTPSLPSLLPLPLTWLLVHKELNILSTVIIRYTKKILQLTTNRAVSQKLNNFLIRIQLDSVWLAFAKVCSSDESFMGIFDLQ